MTDSKYDLKGYAEAAKVVGHGADTIRSWIKTGYLQYGKHYSKPAKSYLFSSKALTELLDIPKAKWKIKT
jgi:hypothetical protein